MLTCKEATRLVSESLDRELSFRQRFGLRVHLLLCHFCRRYKRQLLFLQSLMQTYGEADGEVETAVGGAGGGVGGEEGEGGAAGEAGLSPEARARIRERLR